MRVKGFLAGLAMAFVIGPGAVPAAAQDQSQTLADIRQELSVLFVEIQQLKRELSTTGGVSGNAGGGSMLDRVDTIEGELSRLIAKTENLEFRVDQIVRDGTNQIGDLTFRLCELESDCDIAAQEVTKPLGGGELPAGPVIVTQPPTDGGELAMGEQADYDAAVAALNAGDFASAAETFETFTQTYPAGPLTGEAHFLRGEALAGLGQTSSAARAYLTSFSGSPNGPRAADSLYKLGTSLGELGQTNEACVTLGEVEIRFPGSPVIGEAHAAMQSLGCN